VELVHRPHQDSNTQHDLSVHVFYSKINGTIFSDVFLIVRRLWTQGARIFFVFFRFIINFNSVILSLLDDVSLDSGTPMDLEIC
jgi:hypothetical protein